MFYEEGATDDEVQLPPVDALGKEKEHLKQLEAEMKKKVKELLSENDALIKENKEITALCKQFEEEKKNMLFKEEKKIPKNGDNKPVCNGWVLNCKCADCDDKLCYKEGQDTTKVDLSGRLVKKKNKK